MMIRLLSFVVTLLLLLTVVQARRGKHANVLKQAPPAAAAAAESDNESSYNWPPHEDAMILAHNAIRAEIDDMQKVLEKLAANTFDDDSLAVVEHDKVKAIQKWCKGHEAHMRFHCQAENEHLHPAIQERCLEVPLDQIQCDHANIYALLDEISTEVSKLDNDPKLSSIQNLLQLWTRYKTEVTRHFTEEEAHTILAIRSRFSAKDWGPIIKSYFDLGAKESFGSLIYCMGEQEFRSVFMKQRSIPSFVWRVAFKGKLRFYESNMAVHMRELLLLLED